MQLRDAGGFHTFIAQQSGGSERSCQAVTHVVWCQQHRGKAGMVLIPPKQLNK